jgi:serine/threonine protein kinase
VIVEAGRAKLIDLSVARAPGRARAGLGTWSYMAPEQARGGTIGPQADVWGLGIVLYEGATGKAAYPDDIDEDVEYPQLLRRPMPVTSWRRLPGPFAEIIDACLDSNAAARPELTAVLAACEDAASQPASERRFGHRECPRQDSSLRPAAWKASAASSAKATDAGTILPRVEASLSRGG